MSTRARILSFGSCAALIVVGVLCGILVPAGTGQLLALVFISVGLTLAVGLGFLEVGLSEDRERAREAAARRRAEARADRRDTERRPRLERGRGHRRRLP